MIDKIDSIQEKVEKFTKNINFKSNQEVINFINNLLEEIKWYSERLKDLEKICAEYQEIELQYYINNDFSEEDYDYLVNYLKNKTDYYGFED